MFICWDRDSAECDQLKIRKSESDRLSAVCPRDVNLDNLQKIGIDIVGKAHCCIAFSYRIGEWKIPQNESLGFNNLN